MTGKCRRKPASLDKTIAQLRTERKARKMSPQEKLIHVPNIMLNDAGDNEFNLDDFYNSVDDKEVPASSEPSASLVLPSIVIATPSVNVQNTAENTQQ